MDPLKQNKVAYVYSRELEYECNKLPTMLNRASIVQDLIQSYNLLNKMDIINSQKATEEELKQFHSTNYIDFLKKTNDCDDLEEFDEEQLTFGLGYDCPILKQVYNFAATIAGSSLTAASAILSKKYQVAINWFGGWHHAQRDEAEGFCYVNDIVLAIQKLTSGFQRVLYVDLDIHHGNGVQNAFEYSNKIVTLSFHKYEKAFYPGSGGLETTDLGSGKGKYHSLNVPLKHGIGHKNYTKIFNEIFPYVVNCFKPNVIVTQCGADGLTGDPNGESNLTLSTIGECVQKILEVDVPKLFLGGGGYNFYNTARLWTYLTGLIIGCDLEEDIPDVSRFFTKYTPTFELHIRESFQIDENSDEYIEQLIKQVKSYSDHIKNC